MKNLIAFLVVLLLFTGAGQLVGSLVFMSMRHMPKHLDLTLLFDALGYYRAGLMSAAVQKTFFIAGGISAAVTLLPPLLLLLALLIKKKPSLHGDARFANDMEMKPYKYNGSYQ